MAELTDIETDLKWKALLLDLAILIATVFVASFSNVVSHLFSTI